MIEFQIHQAINREFYCRIVASNGEVLFTSQTYHNKQDLVHAANVVRAYAAHAQSSTTLRNRHRRNLCRMPTPAR